VARLYITGTEADSSAYTFLCTGFTNNDALFSYRGDISISGYGRGDNSTGVYLGNDMQTGYDLNGEYSSDPSWLSSGITVVATLAGGTGGTALTADSSLSTYDGPLTITASAPVGETAIQTTDASFSTQGSNGTISISGSGQFELGYINYAAPEPPATGPAVFITTDASMVLNNNIELSSGYLELSAPGGISSIDSGKVLAPGLLFSGPLDFSQSDMEIQTIAGTAPGASVWVDQSTNQLTIGSVGGTNGISAGTVFLKASGLTIDQPISASGVDTAVTGDLTLPSPW